MLVELLRLGGYLIAETNPKTNNVIATHLVMLGAAGFAEDKRTACHGVVPLADAKELAKDTAELVEQLYTTPVTDLSSLATRFYGGSFPESDQHPDSTFAIPGDLRKSGASLNEVREASALIWGYALWEARYALSMPIFAANPAASGEAAEKKRKALIAKFLRSNHMDSNFNLMDFDKIQNVKQFQERVELFRRLDKYLDDALQKEADPTLVRANLSMLRMPLRVDVYPNHEGQFVTTSPPKLLFLWQRLATGGFAVQEITWDW